MGVKRQQEASSTCTVVLVGDPRVGKTALVNRLVANKFTESYFKTSSSGERVEWNSTVAGRPIHYSIVDLGGSKGGASSSVSSKSTSTLSLHTNHTTSGSLKSSGIFREADVFMLCYRISDPGTLFTAINFWCPEIRCHAPTTPIILVGCQSDLRSDRDILSSLARRGQAPVSADQGLTLSQQSGCVLYTETSSKVNPQSVLSTFEVAALAKVSHMSRVPHHPNTRIDNMSISMMSLTPSSSTAVGKPMPPPVPPKPLIQNFPAFPQRISPPVPPKPRRAISTMALNSGPNSPIYDKENYFQPHHPHETGKMTTNYVSQNHLDQSMHQHHMYKSGFIHRPVSRSHLYSGGSSPRLSFKTSKDRSMSSLLSLSQRTPKMARKQTQNQEKTVTIKCQRMNAERQFEEVEVEVPAPIYETLRFYNSESSASSGMDTTSSRGSRHSGLERNTTSESFGAKTRTLTSRIKSLFGKT